MTPEERWERIEKKTEFLLEQQARFFASLDAQRESIDRNSEQIQRNSQQIQRNSQQIGDLTGVVSQFVRVVDNGFSELRASQARTEEKLNILIDVVERYFSNGQR